MNSRQQTLQHYSDEATRFIKPLLIFVGIIWLIEIVDKIIFHGALDGLGIIPRHVDGLRGILFAPLLHAGFNHLLANTLPLLLFGFLVMLRYQRRFPFISIVIILVSGLGTWLIAPANTLHIGASGLIFGYFAFLVVSAWYERSFASVSLAVLVILLYGSILWGVLPAGNDISWQGHFFGLIGGGMAAYFVSLRRV